VITARDRSVSPTKQRELAAAIGGPVFEAPTDHLDLGTRADLYNPALLQALSAVRAAESVGVA
jgi:hypothetical protein